jgi:predicted Ser/Thr protein kinase
MHTHDRCHPQCGAPLPADAPAGLCPACLLNQGLVGATGGAEAAASVPDMQRTPGHDATMPFTPGGTFVPPTPADLAGRFPQLEVLELIGRGGMGAVYKARQPGLDRLVALKILPPEAGRDAAFAERFTREARALARLNHPHIVAVYDFGQADGLYYFLMEYVDGVNLRQAQQAGQMQPADALRIVPQICDALQYAHDEGIVHRDIKPENVLLDRRGRVKIADFGLAKLLSSSPLSPGEGPGVKVPAADPRLTATGQVMGTYHYMAPEQMERPQEVDHRADIYALGVVFYEMLTGELPLGRFAPPSHVVRVDVRLDDVVLRTLEKKPERRYQHASEVKSEVESISRGPAVVGSAAPPKSGDFGYEMVTPAEFAAALDRTRGPGIGLLVTGIINLVGPLLIPLLGLFVYWLTPSMAVLGMAGVASSGHSSSAAGAAAPLVGVFGIGPMELLILSGFCLNIPLAIVTILGGLQLKNLGSRGLAYAGAIAALIPCGPGWVISAAMGIWALIVLGRPDVKRAFGQPAAARATLAAAAVREEPSELDAAEVSRQVRGPAIGLIVVACLIVFFPLCMMALVPTWVSVRAPATQNSSGPPWESSMQQDSLLRNEPTRQMEPITEAPGKEAAAPPADPLRPDAEVKSENQFP